MPLIVCSIPCNFHTSYLDSCSEVIRLLYEELMLPLPAEIASPTLDTSHATSDGESPFCAVKKRPLVTTAAAAEDSSRLFNISFLYSDYVSVL